MKYEPVQNVVSALVFDMGQPHSILHRIVFSVHTFSHDFEVLTHCCLILLCFRYDLHDADHYFLCGFSVILSSLRSTEPSVNHVLYYY